MIFLKTTITTVPVPGFTRLALPRWSRGKDAFLLIRRSQVRAAPVAGFEVIYVNCLTLSSVSLTLDQRVCTSREEMGGGWGFSTQIEPN